ncbi:Uncharacterised protein [Nocardia farcinica]|uniref:hypothetical protein n=1 Tax=Nocardia farcinica TaxID=37329 RepID=UPI000E0772C7|nr:hypothetical protein [Nocardia farcinica]SUE28916.1 Uncharacterised protein [Nocardia farcinica]
MGAAVARLRRDEPEHSPRLDRGTITVPKKLAPICEAPLPTTGTYPPLFAVLGAHGGAATSTLARWWAPAADTGLAWPASPRTTQQVVVAARLCIPGLTAAAERLREWHAGLAPDGVEVIGLALTPARPGRIPAAVRRYRTVVTDLVDAVYDIGWHDELIVTDLPDLAQYLPFDPPPPRRRSPRLGEAVPLEVHRAGERIIHRLAETYSTAVPSDSECTP